MINKEIKWMETKASTIKEDKECITREFKGKIPHKMAMNALLKNKEHWTILEEGGQGKDSFWRGYKSEYPIREYSIHYNTYTGIVSFSINEAKQ